MVLLIEPMLPPWASPTESELEATVRRDLRRPNAILLDSDIEPVDHRITSPGTVGLYRVSGTAVDGIEQLDWSLFVKVLQSPRHWPGHLEDQTRRVPWDYEVDLYWSTLRYAMPGGLRLPELYRVYDAGDQRLAMWMQDIRTADVAWDLPRFRRAATLLGRLNARMTVEDLLPSSASFVPGEPLRVAPPLGDNPLIDGQDPTLRSDLKKLAARIPALVDSLDAIPRAMVHGDASPQNLLVPADAPDAFVPIDWSARGLVAVGYDLAQLVIGYANTGRIVPLQLPMLTDVVVDAYAAGLAQEGMPVDPWDVRYGMETTLVLRNAFASLPLDGLADRIRLTRYLVDLGLAR